MMLPGVEAFLRRGRQVCSWLPTGAISMPPGQQRAAGQGRHRLVPMRSRIRGSGWAAMTENILQMVHNLHCLLDTRHAFARGGERCLQLGEYWWLPQS